MMLEIAYWSDDLRRLWGYRSLWVGGEVLAAYFAAASACSLPSMPWCPGTHEIASCQLGWRRCIMSIRSRTPLIIDCPDCLIGWRIVVYPAWLSEYRWHFGWLSWESDCHYLRARLIASISAVNTLNEVSLPRCCRDVASWGCIICGCAYFSVYVWAVSIDVHRVRIAGCLNFVVRGFRQFFCRCELNSEFGDPAWWFNEWLDVLGFFSEDFELIQKIAKYRTMGDYCCSCAF